MRRIDRPAGVDHLGLIRAAATLDELQAAFAAAYKSTKEVP